jgi:hypothetical protein
MIPEKSASTVTKKGAHTMGLGYQIAIDKVFLFLLVAGRLAFLASLGFEHKNIKEVEQGRKLRGSSDDQNV